jgi:Holliday junction resolvase
VTRTASDNAGNTTPQSTTFTVVVDAAGICALIQQWSDNAGAAHSLCVKLDKNNMRPFRNELAAQRGKHLPADKADVILGLSQGL